MILLYFKVDYVTFLIKPCSGAHSEEKAKPEDDLPGPTWSGFLFLR